MSIKPTIHKFTIKGEDDTGTLFTHDFNIVSDTPAIPRWRESVYTHAIRCLWENRWTPGSVLWKVFSEHGIDLRVGENY